MAAKRDLYEVLGISKTADEKTIKKAYRKLAKKYHPDMNPGDKTAEQKFKEATDAYNILSDPEKRKLYDQYGHAAFDGTGAESEFYKNYQNYGGAHGGYQELFGSGSFRQKGSDAHADISISFDEAVTGCDKVIHLQDQNGAMQSLQVHIPAGIDTGKSVRLRGKGNPGIGGGEAGDLFLKVTVGEKQGFERKGNDVYTTINVPFSTAVCGGEAVIKTLYGNVICKIKEGTQSGSKIRLRGKGMPLMKNPSQKGDQYAVVQIQVPKNVSQQAKNKLKEFEALCGQRGNASY
ncbi:MAG: J domain-containing protein [Lachnospiraceae bacterium]|nr:J domain-containing protein [Lachnospiraceae bacterium]